MSIWLFINLIMITNMLSDSIHFLKYVINVFPQTRLQDPAGGAGDSVLQRRLFPRPHRGHEEDSARHEGVPVGGHLQTVRLLLRKCSSSPGRGGARMRLILTYIWRVLVGSADGSGMFGSTESVTFYTMSNIVY